MSTPIIISDTVRVPGSAIEARAVRASGPGGQNVNKVATKIDLRVDLTAIAGLPADARVRLAALVRRRRDAEGRLVVTSQATRNQARNLEDARDKVRALVQAALARPQPRRATRPSAATTERRLAAKKRRATLKQTRGRPAAD